MTQTADQVETITTRWSSPTAAGQLTVVDPATGRPLAVVPSGGPPEVDAAVRAAHAAQPLPSGTAPGGPLWMM